MEICCLTTFLVFIQKNIYYGDNKENKGETDNTFRERGIIGIDFFGFDTRLQSLPDNA